MSTEPDTASLRPPPAPKRVRFAELGGPAMAALLDGDLPAASRITGVPLTGYFLTDRARWLWRYRLDQMAAEPGEARWMVRQAVLGDGGEVVGHAGFHGPPDAAGMVEIAYSVAPEYRRQGVRCNAILPSVIDTPANREAQPDADHSKWVEPEEIARVVRFLVSDESAVTSGAAVPVYGRA
jgi:NAD(P)-dependent dehydrogenase (short-subunit alcohol dehydrogenase family)